MKKKIIITAAALLVAALFIPVPKTYADGTKSYNAIAYKTVKWNRPYYKGLMFTQTETYRFPHSLKSVNELWEGMAIDPAVTFVIGTVEKTAQEGVTLRITEGNDDFAENETAEIITDKTDVSLTENETVKVEYVPSSEVSKDKKIKNPVDIETETTAPAREKISVNYTAPVKDTYHFSPEDSLHYIRIYPSGYYPEPRLDFIKTREEFDAFIDNNKSALESAENTYSPSFEKLNKKYSDRFFASCSLAVIRTSESSGSNYYKGVVIDPGSKSITVRRYVPEVRTCDMASWLIIDEIQNNNGILKYSKKDVDVRFETEDSVTREESPSVPGNIQSDVYVTSLGRGSGSISPGLKEADAETVKKILGKYSFDTPGYDNISDVLISTADNREYYYDSASGIITVITPDSDRAVKITEADRQKLNGILDDYITLGLKN